jgi:hypothetical protein
MGSTTNVSARGAKPPAPTLQSRFKQREFPPTLVKPAVIARFH